MSEESKPSAQIAVELRVFPKSVREWRRRWAAGRTDVLASSGPGGSDCKLSDEQFGEVPVSIWNEEDAKKPR